MKLTTISAIFALCLGAAAQAQDLTKEITIERDIHPTLRAASRVNTLPTLLQPNVDTQRLTFSDMTTAADVPGMITSLEPATSAPAIEISPYRGYAGLGYFPAFNLGASAGYRFINRADARLGAWLQYDGNKYKSTYPGADSKLSLSRHTVAAGIDFTKIFTRAGRLDISADYAFNSLTRPWIDDNDLTTNKFNIAADWSARRREMAYFISAAFGRFAYGDPDRALVGDLSTPNLAQTDIKAKVGTAYFLTPHSSFSGHVDVDLARFNHFNRLLNVDDGPTRFVAGDAKTISVVSFVPSYRYRGDNFRARIGLSLQITSNSGSTLHVAPDVNFTFIPASKFSAYLTLDGGEKINRLSDLFDYCPYLSSSVAYKNSNVPVAIKAGISVGPFHGLAFQLEGGYASANDWLMPSIIAGTYAYTPTDLRAWHASLGAQYSLGDLLRLSAKYTIAPGDDRHALYLNRDRAKHVALFSVKSSPIDKLSIEASFELRACRAAYVPVSPAPSAPLARYGLGNDNSLSIGADYAITPSLTIFARGENLLDRRADMLPGLQSQGLKGLVGAAFKF